MSKEDEKPQIEEGGVGSPPWVVQQVNEYLAAQPQEKIIIIVIDAFRCGRTRVKAWRRIQKSGSHNT